MRFIGAPELRSRLPIAGAVDALDVAFAREDRSLVAPLRNTLATPSGTLLTMPAAGDAGVGIKLVTLSEFNPQRGLPFIHAVYVLFDAVTQEPEAVIDGSELTALRTAAVSGLATRHLANADASRLVLFGAGVQAAAHLDAMLAVRPIRDVVVVGRSPARRDALVDHARSLGLVARAGDPTAVRDADIVCTCTTSAVSVFSGHDLAAGAHVNAVGAFLAHQRELDTEAVRRAKVVVETREVALAEAGDLVIPIQEGAFDASHIVADLGEVARGAAVRRSPNDVTAFVSVGFSFEDLVVARAAMEAVS
jgi:ornithine cyclodeaminase/alanine dehydrogenase-like protein (mu-crystallin family)